jgi:hypothetical protein
MKAVTAIQWDEYTSDQSNKDRRYELPIAERNFVTGQRVVYGADSSGIRIFAIDANGFSNGVVMMSVKAGNSVIIATSGRVAFDHEYYSVAPEFVLVYDLRPAAPPAQEAADE